MASRYLDTARCDEAHLAPRAKSLVHIRAVPSKAFAVRINAEREAAGWSYETLGRVLGIDKKDAYAMCRPFVGKATAEQLALVLARAPRRAA